MSQELNNRLFIREMFIVTVKINIFEFCIFQVQIQDMEWNVSTFLTIEEP